VTAGAPGTESFVAGRTGNVDAKSWFLGPG